MRRNGRLDLQSFVKENALNGDLCRGKIHVVVAKCRLPGSYSKRVFEEENVDS